MFSINVKEANMSRFSDEVTLQSEPVTLVNEEGGILVNEYIPASARS